MQTLTIIVVSYNTRDLTYACLESVYRETALPDFEVIVVDNASEDGSAEMIREKFSQVRLLALDENAGFAAANNRAAAEADGRYILLLNPDTVVLDGAIDRLVAFAAAHPEYGIYGGATRFPDGSRNPTSGWNMANWWSLLTTGLGLSSLFRGSRIFDSESLAHWNWQTEREVDIVTGCFFLIRRDLWQSLGGFDVRFHMYGEDADLCLRARSLGARPVIVPAAEIIHYGGASETAKTEKLTRLLRAKVQLFRKHWSPFGAAYAVAMLRLWAWSRTAALSVAAHVKPSLAEASQAWRAVWRRRREWSHAA